MRRLALCLALPLALSACEGMGGKLDRLLGRDSEKSEEKLPGTREPVLGASAELTPDPELKDSITGLEALPANAAWPQVNATAAGIAGNLAYAGTGESDDRATIGHGESYDDALVSPPIVAANMAFAMDGEGSVSAHAADGLSQVWRSDALVPEHGTPLPGGGLAYARGRVLAVNSAGLLVALDAAHGNSLWTYALNLPVRTPPRVIGTLVLVQTADQQLYAFNLADGQLRWRHRGTGDAASLMAQTAPAASGTVAVVAYGSGDLAGVSLDTGEELWTTSLASGGAGNAGFSGFSGSPVIAEGIAIAGSNSGTLAAVDIHDGQHAWDQNLFVRGTPCVVGDTVFVVTTTDLLYALDRSTGKARWSSQLPAYEDADAKQDPYLWQGPVLAGGKLWLVSARGRLLGVAATDGKIATDVSVPEHVRHAPVVARQRLWLLDADAVLHSVK